MDTLWLIITINGCWWQAYVPWSLCSRKSTEEKFIFWLNNTKSLAHLNYGLMRFGQLYGQNSTDLLRRSGDHEWSTYGLQLKWSPDRSSDCAGKNNRVSSSLKNFEFSRWMVNWWIDPYNNTATGGCKNGHVEKFSKNCSEPNCLFDSQMFILSSCLSSDTVDMHYWWFQLGWNSCTMLTWFVRSKLAPISCDE